MWDGEIAPATIEQVRKGKDGKVHVIGKDVGGVAEDLARIDKGLHLRYSEAGDYYVVYHLSESGQELVGTYQQCDKRIVRDVERVRKQNESATYSFADELEKREQAADREQDRKMADKTGEIGERLHHAMNRDLHVKSRIVVPDA